MLTDEKEVRELAVQRILKARKSTLPPLPIVFQVPKRVLNLACYINLINWKTNRITAPPVVNELSDEDIAAFTQNGTGNDPNTLFLHVPNQTQAVERAVKVTTEASISVYIQKYLQRG